MIKGSFWSVAHAKGSEFWAVRVVTYWENEMLHTPDLNDLGGIVQLLHVVQSKS